MNTNHNHTVASPSNHPKDTTKTMEQDLFQFFDSLSQPSPVGDWFTTTSSTASAANPLPSSTHSSPEIATPLDIHLSPSTKVENIPSCMQATSLIGTTTGGIDITGNGGADLDMSEILNSPIFDSPSSTPAMTPAMPQVDMFSDIHQDLPSALAAFVAAVSSVTNNSTNTTSSTPIIPTLPLTNINMDNNSSSSSSSSNNDNIQDNNNNNRKRSHSSTTSNNNNQLTPDEAAIKRQKNTDAARRSRLKKVMKMESLEKRVNELERMNAQLLLRVAVLDSEKSHLQTKEATHEARIKTLESQLAEAHKALASRS